MVRTLIISLLIAPLFLGCTNELDLELLSPDFVFQQMNVDFTTEVIDEQFGIVRLIDTSEGVDLLTWKYWSGDQLINLPNSYPGDTLLVTFLERGTYVIELTGLAKAREIDENGDIRQVDIKKTKVQSLELLDIEPIEFDLQPYLSYVRINSFPEFDKQALPWDVDGSGPDVTIEVSYVYNDEFIDVPLTGAVYNNLLQTDLPITEVVNYDFSMLNVTMSFELIDFDLPRENKYLVERMLIESFLITVSNYPFEPGLIEYNNKHITIGVDWR